MASAEIRMVFRSGIEKVWSVVTDNQRYAWRSDLDRIEILDEKTFVEYTKSGVKTRFTVTAAEPCRQYGFTMENDNMHGRWTGTFREVPSGTEIDFREEAEARSPVMNLFAGLYLKKQLKRYIADLKRELGEE